MNKFLINFSRILLAGLIVFELLNQFKVLNYPLTFTWLGLILTSTITWLLLEIISFYTQKKCGRPISGLSMLTATAVVYLDALGDIFLFYARYGWYDQIAHFIGGAAVCGIVFSVIKSLVDCQRIKLGLFGQGFFSLMTAAFLGVIYELEEYFEDIFTGSHRLGDGLDTANDLFLDLTGALVILILIIFYFYVSGRSRSAD